MRNITVPPLPTGSQTIRDRVFILAKFNTFRVVLTGEIEGGFDLPFVKPGDNNRIYVMISEYSYTDDIIAIAPEYNREMLVTDMSSVV